MFKLISYVVNKFGLKLCPRQVSDLSVVGVLVFNNWGVVRVSWPRVTGGAPRGKPSAGKDITSFRLCSRESCSRQPLAPVQSIAVKFAYQ